MHRLSVPWPKVDRDRIEQEAEIFSQAIMVRTKIILPDSGPLFSFFRKGTPVARCGFFMLHTSLQNKTIDKRLEARLRGCGLNMPRDRS
jgi:hypothetical protein